MVGVSPALGAGVVTVGHAAALRDELAGGAGGDLVAVVRLPVPGRQHHGLSLTGKTLPDSGCELWLTADSFKLGSDRGKYQKIRINKVTTENNSIILF